MRNENKRNKDSLQRLDFVPCLLFHRKRKRGVDQFIGSGLTGLEPAASALTGRCSDRLNYNPSHMHGIHSLMISEEHSICRVATETRII